MHIVTIIAIIITILLALFKLAYDSAHEAKLKRHLKRQNTSKSTLNFAKQKTLNSNTLTRQKMLISRLQQPHRKRGPSVFSEFARSSLDAYQALSEEQEDRIVAELGLSFEAQEQPSRATSTFHR